jgi:hypothetical protein
MNNVRYAVALRCGYPEHNAMNGGLPMPGQPVTNQVKLGGRVQSAECRVQSADWSAEERRIIPAKVTTQTTSKGEGEGEGEGEGDLESEAFGGQRERSGWALGGCSVGS